MSKLLQEVIGAGVAILVCSVNEFLGIVFFIIVSIIVYAD